jgi:hypothetical protein
MNLLHLTRVSANLSSDKSRFMEAFVLENCMERVDRLYTASPTAKDLTGQKFNRWTVLGMLGRYNLKIYCLCVCECGTTRELSVWDVASERSKSCGCLKIETAGRQALKHGLGKAGKLRHPAYESWAGMVQRCTNKNKSVWEHYGGRGITVCDEWLTFENFRVDMLPTWSAGMTLERLDTNAGYSKSNCMWITKSEQKSNTRASLLLHYCGVGYSVSDLAELKGISYATLQKRLAYHDITVEQAVDGYFAGKFAKLPAARSLDIFKRYK